MPFYYINFSRIYIRKGDYILFLYIRQKRNKFQNFVMSVIIIY